MKPRILLNPSIIFSVILLSFTSCGPSSEEIAVREAYLKDSLQQVNDQFNAHQAKFAKGIDLRMREFHKSVKKVENDLEMENAKLKKIEEPVFGRFAYEKEEQINLQMERIRMLENVLSSASDFEIHLKNPIQHEEQKGPKSTAIMVARCFIEGEYEILCDVLDPYFEDSKNLFELITMLNVNPDVKQRFGRKPFKKYRFLNEEIVDNTATIEVLLEGTQNWVTTFALVKRHDFWYLKDISK